MRHFRIIFGCPILLMVLALTGRAQADQQKYETITVRSAETNNGVVIVKAMTETGAIELQCNQNDPACGVLDSGKYSMVRLPKDWGRYECANAEVYALAGDEENHDAENHGTVLGAYCLVGK